MSNIHVTLVLVFAGGLVGCANPHADETSSDPQLTLTHPEFATLAYAVLPALPSDPTNALLAETTKLALAEKFGHRLFFERRFAGPLLDPDNIRVGGDDPYIKSGALGNVGEVGKVACASCHMPDSSFLDARSSRQTLSLGAGWTPRRAISLLDVGFESLLMWDGRHDAAWNQILTPLENHLEINSGRLYVAQTIAGDERYRMEYEQLFGALPPVLDTAEYPRIARPGCTLDDAGKPTQCHGSEGDGAEYDNLALERKEAITRLVVNLGKAIEAYERKLRCGIGRFDQWVYGNEGALTADEVRGARLFIGKAGCVGCHNGQNLSDGKFHNVGIEPGGPQALFMTPNDPGAQEGMRIGAMDSTGVESPFSDDRSSSRRSVTIVDNLLGAFKTPRLRCVAQRPSYFHTGQYRSLTDVVAFKNRGGDTQGFVGTKELVPRGLSPQDENDLIAFLKALDGLPGTGTDERWTHLPVPG